MAKFPPTPPTDDRDIALGQFMSAWGYLERQLLFIFHILIGKTFEIAFTIFLTGFRSSTLSDLLKALGQIQLRESEQKQLKNLCKRYTDAAERRNRIVHGDWILERNPSGSFPTQWVRLYFPINPSLQKQIHNKFNQKTQRKYRFTIDQLLKCREDIEALTNDMRNFGGMIMNRLYPEKLP